MSAIASALSSLSIFLGNFVSNIKFENMFKNETLVSIGEKYGKSSAQTALRFLVQEGIVVIPKSVKKERMEQNINIFDFKLTDDEIERIRSLDLGHSLFFSHQDPQTVEMIINLSR